MTDFTSDWRQLEANRLIDVIDDPMLKDALQFALATALTRRMTVENAPDEFDLVYLLDVVKAMFERERIVRAILDGRREVYNWW